LKKTGTFFLVRDNIQLGLILGLLTPLVVFVLVYYIRFSGWEFSEFIEHFKREKRIITFWGVWCLVGNMALFTYYINTNKYKTAKGIFAVTLIYGIGILLVKLIV